MQQEPVIDLSRAIGLSRAAQLMRGRRGKCPHIVTLRRWANPKRGCYPAGPAGPQLVLATFRWCGDLLTYPEWVEAFERERARLGAMRPGGETPTRPPSRRAAGHRRAEAELERKGVRAPCRRSTS